jgi:hypothetical protein
VLWNAPIMMHRAEFCTHCSVLMCLFCPQNQIAVLYVRVGMHIALYAQHQLVWSKPHTELPRSWRALRVLHVLEETTVMCLSHESL